MNYKTNIKIDTKFKVGQTVYYIHFGKIRYSVINHIEIKIYEGDVLLTYKICGDKNRSEDSIFGTAQELIDHLLSDITERE